MLKDFNYQVNGLKYAVFLYAPIYMYIFLKMYESKDKDISNELSKNIGNISGKMVSEWPKIECQEFNNLFTPEKKWINIQREFIYFLIFSISGYAFNFINISAQDKMFIIVDELFDVLRDKKTPWYKDPIDEDAYNKYKLSDNYLIKLNEEITKITGQDDSLFLVQFQTRITGIFKYHISPAIDKLFVKNNST